LGRRLLRIVDEDEEVELVFERAGSETGELLVTPRAGARHFTASSI
jgi:hypothetical protein